MLYKFRTMLGGWLAIHLSKEELKIERAPYSLRVPLDAVISEVGYGFLGVQGLALNLEVEGKRLCLFIYRPIPMGCRMYAQEDGRWTLVKEGREVLESMHGEIERALGPYRSSTMTSGGGPHLGYLLKSLFSSWRKGADVVR